MTHCCDVLSDGNVSSSICTFPCVFKYVFKFILFKFFISLTKLKIPKLFFRDTLFLKSRSSVKFVKKFFSVYNVSCTIKIRENSFNLGWTKRLFIRGWFFEACEVRYGGYLCVGELSRLLLSELPVDWTNGCKNADKKCRPL